MWAEIIFYNFFLYQSVKSFQYKRFIRQLVWWTRHRWEPFIWNMRFYMPEMPERNIDDFLIFRWMDQMVIMDSKKLRSAAVMDPSSISQDRKAFYPTNQLPLSLYFSRFMHITYSKGSTCKVITCLRKSPQVNTSINSQKL